VDLGVPMGLVIASIHEKRAELRSRIQRDRSAPLHIAPARRKRGE
jgi:CPA2 family monovalent cation:H+ antiporter-2